MVRRMLRLAKMRTLGILCCRLAVFLKQSLAGYNALGRYRHGFYVKCAQRTSKVESHSMEHHTLVGAVAALQADGWTRVPGVGTADHLLELGRALGTPVAVAGRPVVQILRPQAAEAAPRRTYSARFGRGAFPFHTDMANWSTPPRWILLRSAGPPSVTPTLVWNVLGGLPTALLRDIERAVFATRTRVRSYSCTILSWRGGRPSLRWDPLALAPVDAFSAGVAQRLNAYIAEHAEGDATKIPWPDNHHALVIDNWRILHARPESADNTRVLERIVVSENN